MIIYFHFHTPRTRVRILFRYLQRSQKVPIVQICLFSWFFRSGRKIWNISNLYEYMYRYTFDLDGWTKWDRSASHTTARVLPNSCKAGPRFFPIPARQGQGSSQFLQGRARVLPDSYKAGPGFFLIPARQGQGSSQAPAMAPQQYFYNPTPPQGFFLRRLTPRLVSRDSDSRYTPENLEYTARSWPLARSVKSKVNCSKTSNVIFWGKKDLLFVLFSLTGPLSRQGWQTFCYPNLRYFIFFSRSRKSGTYTNFLLSPPFYFSGVYRNKVLTIGLKYQGFPGIRS